MRVAALRVRYDSNGNTLTSATGSNTTSYAWDFENRLSSVTLPGSGGTVTFKYDPFDRRIYKSSSSGTSIFAYDGNNLIEETNSSGAAVARYSQTQNIDEPLAMLRSGATSYYHADGLSSVTSLSNAAGSIANTYTYDSFGKLTNSSGSLVNPFRYTARESDTETGLYYYRARYYDIQTGRFVSEDHLRFTAGINFYAYVRGRPVNLTDPYGLKTLGLGGTVINLSKCCLLVSSNEANPNEQQQYYIPPGESSGPFADVDAIYFPNGSALKIPDWDVLIVWECPGPGMPRFRFKAPTPWKFKRFGSTFLPDRDAINNQFHEPIIPPKKPCKDQKCP
ncbi:MAG TPA: RHS repeat-associated core domain-containing protein [Candidatus Polarisedimenticolia bacterium]|nr:RHS repeat-associated core domain-containing protein [Candidatus Polarisedimenticolia bacterium]